MWRWTPRLGDCVARRLMFDQQNAHRPATGRADALHDAGDGLRERSGRPEPIRERSLYTTARHLRPGAALSAALLGLALGAPRGLRPPRALTAGGR